MSVDLTVLRRLVSQAIEINKLAQKSPQANRSTNGERRNLATRLRQGERFVGNSPLMQTLRERIKKVARTNAPIWITGESGTGKELIARLIHANGPRAQMPFVAINCGAIPNELVERHMQVKVLRAIQEKAIRPVGSHREDTVDVRLLSASHSDLADRVDDGSFRQDLYYRLNVITVAAPPLRERREDIPALVTNILNRLHPESENTVSLDSKAMDRLKSDGPIAEP